MAAKILQSSVWKMLTDVREVNSRETIQLNTGTTLHYIHTYTHTLHILDVETCLK
jgi:hypothetical protein